ncbi:MAG: hypothetical protein N3G76_03220 [Candidatus Micrarchaeota archaeon]|nr:hypothetical protein [Candidatus Micrarchaeota archaeon]
MDRLMLIAMLVLAGIAVLASGCTKPQGSSDTMTFEKSIIDDAKVRYPGADIVEIEGTEEIGGVKVTNVRVTFGSDTICPSRLRLRYKQPFGYETGVPIYIVKDCQVTCRSDCIITGPEEAIIAAHTLPGSERAKEFIGDGSGIKAAAVPSGDVWVVRFKREPDGAVMEVTLTAKNPTIIKVASVEKQ